MFQKSEFSATWRKVIIDSCHYIPLVFIVFEMIINKIRIPLHHIAFCMILTGLYLLTAYIVQISMSDLAVYPHSLNFNCAKDQSYIVDG